MDQQNLTLAKIPILDTRKFDQWQFRIQQYLQHEHYALWEVIEFGDSYEAPKDNATTGSTSDGTSKKKGRIVTLTTDDMQKRKNDTRKDLMAINGVGWDWSYMVNDKENHALVADEEAPTEFALMAKTSAKSKELELIKKEKEGLDRKLAGFQTASKDLDSLLETEASPSTISPKPFIKFVKVTDRSTETKTAKVETTKPAVKYAAMYSKPSKRSKKKACYNCGDFDHLAYDCCKWVKKRTSRSQNNTHKSFTHRPAIHRPYRPPIRPVRPNMNVAQPKRISFHKPAHSYNKKPFQKTSAMRSQFRDPRVATVNRKFPTVNKKLLTVNKKFPTGNTKFSTPDIVPRTTLITRRMQDYEPFDRGFDRGYVSFGQGGCKIIGKRTIKTGKLEFKNVYFVKDLKYNLFSVSQICDNKNSILFTDSECIVLGRDFKLIDDTNMLLRVPRQHNMYSIDLNNIVPHKDLTCLVAKASADKCMLWHRSLGHLNFKTMNKLVRHNLVRGLHIKCFENDHSCTACLKGKQHKASCKSKLVNSVTKPLHTLHMDLFGPTSVSSISHKWYCLVVTDDFSRCDSGGEFRNKEMNDFCSQKWIKREFSNARTPQQNSVTEKRNRILIEAARTMLADAKLPVTFWAEVVNTACYVQNRVLVNKSQNKTPYELFNGRTLAIGFLKPFGCHVMILNTLDNLGKFEAKGDEGYFIRYSMSSKAFRVFNKRTKRVKENVHVEFLENKAIEKGAGPNWLFDIDSLTNSMNYVPVVSAGTNSTNFSGTKDAASQEVKNDVSSLRYTALPN
nr:hypothetical protein [Tanacetum cinerariifolium]